MDASGQTVHGLRTLFDLVLIALAILAAVLLMPSPAGAQAIAGTAHDFSQRAPGRRICVACHAPHGVPDSRLLWNHELSASGFSWGRSTETGGGTALPSNIRSWSGDTKACLSCHDGTVEVGRTYSSSSSWDATIVRGNARIQLGSGHPVAVPYPYGNVKNTYNGIQTGDGVALDSYKAVPTRVKIYTDPAGGPNNRGIECGSCHDPHGTPYGEFLRDTTDGSALCLDCHDM